MKLHITNGDIVSEAIAAAGIAGTTVAYADVLHEGPVPPDDDPASFTQTRAAFLARCGWARAEAAQAHIDAWREHVQRDEAHDEVVLWYEHDLFDQLLLVRLLSWWRRHTPRAPLALVSPADYLGVQSPAQLAELFGARVLVDEAQLLLAADAWSAFTAPEPVGIARLLRDERIAALPHLEGALRRLLEEYPSPASGVGRTERQVLEILAQSPLTTFDLFTANARREERVFMGDVTFFQRLDRMLAARRPLIERSGADAPLQITDNGQRVLDGALDDVAVNGVDRWIGGVHLMTENVWRWDGAEVRRA